MAARFTEEQERKIKKRSKNFWYKASRTMNLLWQKEAQRVIAERIDHYTSTGNVRKLAIYQSKQKHSKYLLGRIKALFK